MRCGSGTTIRCVPCWAYPAWRKCDRQYRQVHVGAVVMSEPPAAEERGERVYAVIYVDNRNARPEWTGEAQVHVEL